MDPWCAMDQTKHAKLLPGTPSTLAMLLEPSKKPQQQVMQSQVVFRGVGAPGHSLSRDRLTTRPPQEPQRRARRPPCASARDQRFCAPQSRQAGTGTLRRALWRPIHPDNHASCAQVADSARAWRNLPVFHCSEHGLVNNRWAAVPRVPHFPHEAAQQPSLGLTSTTALPNTSRFARCSSAGATRARASSALLVPSGSSALAPPFSAKPWPNGSSCSPRHAPSSAFTLDLAKHVNWDELFPRRK